MVASSCLPFFLLFTPTRYLIGIFAKEMTSKFTSDELDEFKALFAQYDKDGNGDIDANELGTMLTELGIEVTQEDIEELLRGIDKDGTHSVDFEEFAALMWRYRNGGESDDDDDVASPQKAPAASGATLENAAVIDVMTPDELASKRDMFLNMKDSLRELFGSHNHVTSPTETPSSDTKANPQPPPAATEKPKPTTTNGAVPASAAPTPKVITPEERAVQFVISSLKENGFTFSPPTDKVGRGDTAEQTARALLTHLGELLDMVERRLSLAVDYVEVGVDGFEDDAEQQRVHLEPMDPAQLAIDLDELAKYEFVEGKGVGAKQGSEAFRHKAKDFPFFMFPIETVCEQLDIVDQRYEMYDTHVGLNEYLLRPRCPDGRDCKLQANHEHRLQVTHPCFCEEITCPNTNQPIHMKCWTHGDEESNATKEAALKELRKLLGVIDITGFEIGDCGAQCFAYVLEKDGQLPKEKRRYTELRAAGNHFSPTGAIPVLDFCMDLVRLDLSSNGLGYRGSLLIAGGGVGPSLHQLLLKADRLTHLNLSRNRLSDNEMKFIADGLKNNSILKHLDLRKNEFGPACGEMLANAMSENRYLSELLLGWNRLEATGTTELLNELQSSSTIELLDLSWTGVSDEGGKHVARMIAGSAALLQVNLSHNGIGKQSAPLISKALQQNKTLVYFDISYNPLGDRGTVEIIKDLRENFTLEHCDLRCTKARDDAHKEITQTLRVREPKMKDIQQKILFQKTEE